MRILHVARRYWPAVGGVESFLHHVATEQAKRHQVKVLAQRIDSGPHERLHDSIAPPPTFEGFSDDGVQVAPLRVPLRRRAMMAPLLTHVLPVTRRYAYGRLRVPAGALVGRAVGPVIAREAATADVVHMWTGDLLASAAVEAGRLAEVPVVISPVAHRDQWGYDPASMRAYARADKVLALLDTEADLYRERGLSEGKLAVSGVCTPQVPLTGEASAREALGLSGPLVLFLGARRPYKGFDLLLHAAERLAAEVPKVRIAFVGPGPPIDPAARGPNVIDVGKVGEDEKALWLNAASLLCLPSEAEILPSSILEAWSVGTPAVTSDIAPLKELMEIGEGGICVPRDSNALASVLVELVQDPDRLRQMGQKGREAWRSRFTPDRVARWHEQVYRSAIAGTG